MQTKQPFFKKLLAVALFFVAIICCKAFAVSVTAEEAANTPPTAIATGEYTILAQGKCGTNLTWQLTSDYTLSITGTGNMNSHDSNHSPWGNYATSIKKIDIGAGVTSIGDYAFWGCSGLTSVVIGNSVTSIGEWAFYECSGLTSVVIPNSVTSIGGYAFWGCGKLVEVINYSSLNIREGSYSYGDIGYYALNVKTSGTTDIVNKDGFLFYTYNNVNYLLGYIGTDTNLVLPDSYNGQSYQIYNYAFEYCSGLTSVVIPDSVTSIGDRAFSGCSGLTSVVIPDSVTSIGDRAFYYCSGLTSVVIPDSVTSIGNGAFMYCSGLTSVVIPDSVTSIGYDAFWGCSGLTSVVIGNSVTSIGSYAFYNCSGLTSVVIGNSVTSIGDYAFRYCDKLVEVINYSSLNIIKGSFNYGYIGWYALNVKTSGTTDIVNKNGYLFYTYNNVNYLLGYVGTDTDLVLPDSYNGQNYQIYKYAFYDCDGLTSVVIPDNVTSIGDRAFYDCSGLTSVVIGNSVTTIGSSAFFGCNKLVEVINYSSLNITKGSYSYGDIGYYALNVKTSGPTDIVNKNGYLFYTYNNVNYLLGYIGTDTNLVLPDSYNGQNYQIYNYAFYNCNGLTSVIIPDSVTSIGDYAFYYCGGLTSVVIGNSVTSIGDYAFSSCSSLTSINIPDKVTSINDHAFSDCKSLTSINIPDKVTSINDHAFSDCKSLTSINIPDSVTSIGSSAFSGCSSLTSINIPDNVTSINDHAFSDCKSLTSINIPDSVTSIGDYAFYGCSGLTSVVIGNSVTSIGSSAFSGCSGLTSVVIPDSVTSIGSSAFSGCSSLTSINIPDNITSINGSTFYDCKSLTSINIPDKVTSIGNYAFSGCSGLKGVYINDIAAWCKIDFYHYDSNPLYFEHNLYLNNELVTNLVIPDSVTSIGDYAFSGCSGLTSVVIPDSVTSIGDRAFYYCSGLTSVVIGNSVTSIGERAFSGCSGLTSVVIPDSVTSIGDYAFYYCSGLTSVVIPDSVTSIGDYAFYGCSALNDIFIYSPQVTIYDSSATLPEQTVIHGYLNSTAQKYATKYNRKFVAIECDECSFEEKSKTEATCTKEGKIVKVCKTCGKTVEEPLAALGHTKNAFTALKEATCTQTGKLGYYYCSVCNSYLDENKNVIGDTEDDLIIPAKGHTYRDWIQETPPTCSQTGKLGYYYCSVCNNYLDENENVIATADDLIIPAKGHTYGDWIQEIPATCTQTGKLGYYYCSVCNNYLDENKNVIGDTEDDLIIPAKGHTYGDWIQEIPATCTKFGVLGHYHCSECQNNFDNKKKFLLTIVIEKTEHDYKNKQTGPTCTEDGQIEYTCQNCKGKKVEIIAATGHKYGAWQEDVKPSCDQEGSKHRTCTECTSSETAKVLPLKHKFELRADLSTSVKDVYICKLCKCPKDVPKNGTPNASKETKRVYNDFVFNVISNQGEDYIKNNLRIIYKAFESKYGVGSEESRVDYIISAVSNNVYSVKPTKPYKENATYRVIPYGDVSFEKYNADELILLVVSKKPTGNGSDANIKTNDHENLDNYDHEIISSGPDKLIVRIRRIGNYMPRIGSLWSLGKKYRGSFGSFGKIKKIISSDADSDDVEFEPITLAELLKTGSSGSLSFFANVDELSQQWPDFMDDIKQELADNLLSSENFQSFLAIVGKSANDYLKELGLSSDSLSENGIKIKPTLKQIDSTTFFVGLDVKIEIPIKGKTVGQLGNICLNLTISNQTQILITPFLEKPEDSFCSVTIDFTQMSTDHIDYTIKLDLAYELNDAPEHAFALNKNSLIIHRATCHYITKIVDKNKLQYLTETEMQDLANEPGYLTCEVCKPTDSDFLNDEYLINNKSNTVHRANCIHLEDKNMYNYSLVRGVDNLPSGYDLCDWCKLNNLSEKNFEQKLLKDLRYTDWNTIISEIKTWSEESGSSKLLSSIAEALGGKKSKKSVGIKLGSCSAQYYFFTFQAEIYFVFNFDLKASFQYTYNHTYENSVRLEFQVFKNIFTPIDLDVESDHIDLSSDESIFLVGKMETQAGVKLDASISIYDILGIKVGLEGGAYIFTSGVFSYTSSTSNEDENFVNKTDYYAAAKYEMGLYYDISASITMGVFDFSIASSEDKLPLVALGYDKVYYGYSVSDEEWYVHNAKEINEKISVEYFDLSTLKKNTEKLDLYAISSLYDVSFRFEYDYCKIVNGKIIVNSNAPHNFNDILYVSFTGKTNTLKYVKGSAAFYLPDYVIVIHGFNHSFDDGYQTLAPTCKNTGKKIYSCQLCEYQKYEEIPMVDHDCSIITTIAPSCEKMGYTLHSCKNCSYGYFTDPVDALGHDFYTQSKEATCEQNGYVAEACHNCSYFKIKTEHNAFGHKYSDELTLFKLGTCASPSEYRRYCLNDNSHYITEYKTIEHSYSEKWTIDAQPTCLKKGSKSRHCLVCDSKTDIEEIPRLEHSFGNYVSDNNATCLFDGTKTATCKNLGCTEKITVDDHNSALGHNYIDHKAQAPTCTQVGWEEYYTCGREGCNYTTYTTLTEIPALGHDYIDHKAQAPTCTQVGWGEYYTCGREGCNYTTYTTLTKIPALGHNLVSHEAQAPTCTQVGWEKYYTCSREGCNYDNFVAIPLIEHAYSELIKLDSPTCKGCGFLEYYVCNSCQKRFTPEKKEIIFNFDTQGHYWCEWIRDKEPTDKQNGNEFRTCYLCAAIDERTIDKTESSCVSSILPEYKNWIMFLSVLCIAYMAKQKFNARAKK